MVKPLCNTKCVIVHGLRAKKLPLISNPTFFVVVLLFIFDFFIHHKHNSHHSSTNHQLLFVSTINEWKVTAEVWKLYFCFEIYLWRKILDGSECVKTILLRFWRQSFSSFPGRQPWSWMAAATHCPERNDQDHDHPSSWENPEKS